MSDLNNSGSCGIQDLNALLKNDTVDPKYKVKTSAQAGSEFEIYDATDANKTAIIGYTLTQIANNMYGITVNTGQTKLMYTDAVAIDDVLNELDKAKKLLKIKNKIGIHGFLKIKKYIKVPELDVNGDPKLDEDGNPIFLYFGISEKKMKHSKYSKFNKKKASDNSLTHKYDNTIVGKILDYDDFKEKLNTKEKLQKMTNLTNPDNTIETKFAGTNKDIHITVSGETGETSKSYKIGNFSGWVEDPNYSNKMKYDSNKVGKGSNTAYKKYKTMYWKKNTATGQNSSNGGVYKKKKKKNNQDTSVGTNETALDNIESTQLNDMIADMDQNSPLLEVGEDDKLDAYVLFKLKKKPQNATEITV